MYIQLLSSIAKPKSRQDRIEAYSGCRTYRYAPVVTNSLPRVAGGRDFTLHTTTKIEPTTVNTKTAQRKKWLTVIFGRPAVDSNCQASANKARFIKNPLGPTPKMRSYVFMLDHFIRLISPQSGFYILPTFIKRRIELKIYGFSSSILIREKGAERPPTYTRF